MNADEGAIEIHNNMSLRGRSSPHRAAPSPSLTSEQYVNGKTHRSYGSAIGMSIRKIVFIALLVGLAVLFSIRIELYQVKYHTVRRSDERTYEAVGTRTQHQNQFSLSPGELPGYTGWARPEQTLAGYFRIESSSHDSTTPQYHSIVQSGDNFSLLLTCEHDDNSTYACPDGGTLFYVRAYGPSVITGNVIDHSNTSYTIEFHPIDIGKYTVEVVVTFSAPLEMEDFPLNWNGAGVDDEEEPGYEGYLVHGFPITILVHDDDLTIREMDKTKQWCELNQLTEIAPVSSLTVGHWQAIDHVGRSSHQLLTRDDASVSLDGYRMGINSLGVRMQYEYEDCELLHIKDIVGSPNGENGHVMDRCLSDLGYKDYQPDPTIMSHNGTDTFNPSGTDIDNFHGVHVIFIGDSVMKLEMGFFNKLLIGSDRNQMAHRSRGFNVIFVETNGGLHSNLSNIKSVLHRILIKDEQMQKNSALPNRRVVIFNTGLHDIDILCSSKRKRTRNITIDVNSNESCASAYRNMIKQLVQFIDSYPADIKVFRTTTAGETYHGVHLVTHYYEYILT